MRYTVRKRLKDNEDYARSQGNPIFADLIKFTNRNPKINSADYPGCYSGFRKDSRDATKALNEFSAEVDRAFMHLLMDEDIIDYLKSRISVRLNYYDKWEYTAGQNYPTEFRWAAVETLKHVVDYVYLLTMNDKDKEEKIK